MSGGWCRGSPNSDALESAECLADQAEVIATDGWIA